MDEKDSKNVIHDDSSPAGQQQSHLLRWLLQHVMQQVNRHYQSENHPPHSIRREEKFRSCRKYDKPFSGHNIHNLTSESERNALRCSRNNNNNNNGSSCLNDEYDTSNQSISSSNRRGGSNSSNSSNSSDDDEESSSGDDDDDNDSTSSSNEGNSSNSSSSSNDEDDNNNNSSKSSSRSRSRSRNEYDDGPSSGRSKSVPHRSGRRGGGHVRFYSNSNKRREERRRYVKPFFSSQCCSDSETPFDTSGCLMQSVIGQSAQKHQQQHRGTKKKINKKMINKKRRGQPEDIQEVIEAEQETPVDGDDTASDGSCWTSSPIIREDLHHHDHHNHHYQQAQQQQHEEERGKKKKEKGKQEIQVEDETEDFPLVEDNETYTKRSDSMSGELQQGASPEPHMLDSNINIGATATAATCVMCRKLEKQLFMQQVRLACSELESKKLLQGVAASLRTFKQTALQATLELQQERQQRHELLLLQQQQQQQQQRQHTEQQHRQQQHHAILLKQQKEVIASLQQQIDEKTNQLQRLQQQLDAKQQQQPQQQQQEEEKEEKKNNISRTRMNEDEGKQQLRHEGQNVSIQSDIGRRRVHPEDVYDILQQLQERQARWCESLLRATENKQQQLLLRVNRLQALLQQQERQQMHEQQVDKRRQKIVLSSSRNVAVLATASALIDAHESQQHDHHHHHKHHHRHQGGVEIKERNVGVINNEWQQQPRQDGKEPSNALSTAVGSAPAASEKEKGCRDGDESEQMYEAALGKQRSARRPCMSPPPPPTIADSTCCSCAVSQAISTATTTAASSSFMEGTSPKKPTRATGTSLERVTSIGEEEAKIQRDDDPLTTLRSDAGRPEITVTAATRTPTRETSTVVSSEASSGKNVTDNVMPMLPEKTISSALEHISPCGCPDMPRSLSRDQQQHQQQLLQNVFQKRVEKHLLPSPLDASKYDSAPQHHLLQSTAAAARGSNAPSVLAGISGDYSSMSTGVPSLLHEAAHMSSLSSLPISKTADHSISASAVKPGELSSAVTAPTEKGQDVGTGPVPAVMTKAAATDRSHPPLSKVSDLTSEQVRTETPGIHTETPTPAPPPRRPPPSPAAAPSGGMGALPAVVDSPPLSLTTMFDSKEQGITGFEMQQRKNSRAADCYVTTQEENHQEKPAQQCSLSMTPTMKVQHEVVSLRLPRGTHFQELVEQQQSGVEGHAQCKQQYTCHQESAFPPAPKRDRQEWHNGQSHLLVVQELAQQHEALQQLQGDKGQGQCYFPCIGLAAVSSSPVQNESRTMSEHHGCRGSCKVATTTSPPIEVGTDAQKVSGRLWCCGVAAASAGCPTADRNQLRLPLICTSCYVRLRQHTNNMNAASSEQSCSKAVSTCDGFDNGNTCNSSSINCCSSTRETTPSVGCCSTRNNVPSSCLYSVSGLRYTVRRGSGSSPPATSSNRAVAPEELSAPQTSQQRETCCHCTDFLSSSVTEHAQVCQRNTVTAAPQVQLQQRRQADTSQRNTQLPNVPHAHTIHDQQLLLLHRQNEMPHQHTGLSQPWIVVPQQYKQDTVVSLEYALQHQLIAGSQMAQLASQEERRRPSSLLSQAAVARGNTLHRAGERSISRFSPTRRIQEQGRPHSVNPLAARPLQADSLLPPKFQSHDGYVVQTPQQVCHNDYLWVQPEHLLLPGILPTSCSQVLQKQQEEHVQLLHCAHERVMHRNKPAGAGTGEAPIVAAASTVLVSQRQAEPCCHGAAQSQADKKCAATSATGMREADIDKHTQQQQQQH